MPSEKIPKAPLAANFKPEGGITVRVGDGDSWSSIATKAGIDVWRLIEFNFKTRDPDEVNWYLRRNVGCRKQTTDGKNWMFSKSATPGIVYLPPKATAVKVIAERPAPTNVCTEELDGAKETLKKSAETANTILGPKPTTDLPYWFARLYQYITQAEIDDKDKLSYPCFLLHFIPVFYDSYLVAVDAFKAKGAIPSHWQDHFTMAGMFTDPTMLVPYADAVAKSLATGVGAHIKGDMAPSLEKAYRSFSKKYTGVPSFDTFKPDFFEKNRPVFDKVRLTLVNELVNRGMGFAMMGKSVDPKLASRVADAIGKGLNIDEIYQWREEAWKTAKKALGQA